LGVQLGEQLGGLLAVGALDGDPQRGGAGRPGQAEGRDVLDEQAELVLQPAPDRGSARAGDVQVGGAAAPVGDREHLAGSEHAEGDQRQGHPDGHPDQHVGGGVGAQGHPADRGQGDEPGGHPLAGVAPATLGHQRVQDPHQQPGQEHYLLRRQRPPAPAGLDHHPERPRPADAGTHHGRGRDHQVGEGERDDQMPQAAQHQQRQQ
jgi:hypothetical protein